MEHSFEITPIETIRTSRGRLTSLSSLMSTDPLQQDHTSHHLAKGELIGFRRLAKSIWYDISARRGETHSQDTTKGDSPAVSAIISPNNALALVLSGSPKSNYFSITRRHYTYPKREPEEEGTDAPLVWKSHFEPDAGGFRVKRPFSNDEFPSPPQNTMIRKKPLGESIDNQNNVSIRLKHTLMKTPAFEPSKRVLQIHSLPSFIGLKAVLGQVFGGPLEKIFIHRADKTRQEVSEYDRFHLRNCVVELWFLRSEDAVSFLQYCQSGLFTVNGFHFTPSWAPAHDCFITDQTFYHEPVSLDIQALVKQDGATRCLLLKKYIRKPKVHPKYYPVPPTAHYSRLNLDQIRTEFSAFGEVLEVTPMISKKLSVAVHYFDIASAVAAKKLYDSRQTELYFSYSNWTLEFTRDSTDKPCLNV